MKQIQEMEQIRAKARIHIDLFVIFLKERVLPSHIFAVFVVFFLMALGTFGVMRAVADDYAPVATDFAHLLPTLIIWLLTLLTFAGLAYKLKDEKPLTNVSATLFILAGLGLFFLAHRTLQVYSYVPRNHRQEEAATALIMIRQLNSSLPIKINDDISEQNVLFKNHILVMGYDVKNMDEHNWKAADLRPQLMPQACDYLNRFSKYKTITATLYAFNGEKRNFNILFKAEECANQPAPPNKTPPSQQGSP